MKNKEKSITDIRGHGANIPQACNLGFKVKGYRKLGRVNIWRAVNWGFSEIYGKHLAKDLAISIKPKQDNHKEN